MNLSDTGEQAIIELIDKKTGIRDPRIIAGIGDDAAVIKSRGEKYKLITTDMLIENVHFTLHAMSFSQIGQKALAVNLSDIAAMGGIPEFCLVSLGLNEKASVENIDELYGGLLALAEEYDVKLIGGDTNYSPSGLIIDICVIGKVEPERVCLRSKASQGDSILVTGRLGEASARLKKGEYLPPIPRIREAQAILDIAKVNAMIDISDGLAKDLHRIVKSSNVGAIIYAGDIPVSPGAETESALSGGEDFELLLTVPEEEKDKLLGEIPRKTGTALTCIGKIVGTGVKIKGKDGRISPLPPGGYEHFKSNKKS